MRSLQWYKRGAAYSGNYDNSEIISDNNRFYAVIRNFSIKNLVISGKYPIFAE